MQSLGTKLPRLVASTTSRKWLSWSGSSRQTECASWLQLAGPATFAADLCRPPIPRAQNRPLQGPVLHRRTLSTSANGKAAIESFILHDIGEGIKEVTIKNWMVKVGDQVKEFEPICEVESDKATAEITSRFNGKIARIYYNAGELAAVGQPLVDIELEPIGAGESALGQSAGPREAANDTARPRQVSSGDQCPRAASGASARPSGKPTTLPSVRRLAAVYGVDLTQVNASGKRGQILKEDVLNYLGHEGNSSQTSADEKSGPHARGAAQVHANETGQVMSLSSIQRAMHKTMTKALSIPHFSYADEIDMTELLGMAQRQKEASTRKTMSAAGAARAPSSFAYLIKMVSLALLEFPQLNASLSEDGKQLVVKRRHNIGVAVDTRHGLVVPNIKDVQLLTVGQVNVELLRLRESAYSSKLTTGDLSGATVSLSNIGAIGGTFGVPLIVSPEILIGALGRARRLPRFVNDTHVVAARQVMQVVWSADHRVVDGATLSRFTNLLKQLIEQPETALVRLK